MGYVKGLGKLHSWSGVCVCVCVCARACVCVCVPAGQSGFSLRVTDILCHHPCGKQIFILLCRSNHNYHCDWDYHNHDVLLQVLNTQWKLISAARLSDSNLQAANCWLNLETVYFLFLVYISVSNVVSCS